MAVVSFGMTTGSFEMAVASFGMAVEGFRMAAASFGMAVESFRMAADSFGMAVELFSLTVLSFSLVLANSRIKAMCLGIGIILLALDKIILRSLLYDDKMVVFIIPLKMYRKTVPVCQAYLYTFTPLINCINETFI